MPYGQCNLDLSKGQKAGKARIRTDEGGYFASLEVGRALVELVKDGDSPACPDSWTWGAWYDGERIDGTCEEASLAVAAAGAMDALGAAIDDLAGMRDVLAAWRALCV